MRFRLADLRPFFKSHGLARREIEVVVRDRKEGVATVQTGDDLSGGTEDERLHPHYVFVPALAGSVGRRTLERSPGSWCYSIGQLPRSVSPALEEARTAALPASQ